MKKARNCVKSFLLVGLMLFVGSAACTTLTPQRVAALSVPATFAADPGTLCALPDDNPGNPTGTVEPDGYTCCPSNNTLPMQCLFAKYINPLVQVLSALVGLAVVISIIYGGIQYVTSAGDPQKAEAGKKRIIESLVGLAAFLLLYAFIQYILPGGVLSGS